MTSKLRGLSVNEVINSGKRESKTREHDSDGSLARQNSETCVCSEGSGNICGISARV